MNSKGWAIACLAYLIGLLSTGLLNLSTKAVSWPEWGVYSFVWCIIGCVAAWLLPRWWWRGPKWQVWVLSGCIAGLAIAHLQLRIPQPGPLDVSWLVPQLEDAATIRGEILEMPRLNAKQKVRFVLAAQTVNNEPVTGKLYVTLPLLHGTGLAPRQEIEIAGNLYEPQVPLNPGAFDFRAYLASRGVFAGVSGSLVREVTQPPWGWWRLRQRIVRSQVKGLGSPTGQLVSSMVLGRRAVDLPFDIQERFVKAGLAHTLAASGFHVSLLLGLVLTLTRRLGSRSRLGIGLGVLLLYIGLTGMQPSVMRAALMGVGVLIALVTERRTKPLGLLLLVATILLVIDPLWIWDLGFQLSFLATLGLIVTVRAIAKRLDWLPPTIATLIAVPLAASLWTLPLLIYKFNMVAVYSLAINIVVTPLITLISLGGMIASAIALMLPDAGSAIAFLLYYPAQLLIAVVTFFTDLPTSSWAVGKISTIQLLLIYAGILAAWLIPWFKIGWRWLGIVSAIAILVILPLGYQQGTRVQMTVLATDTEPVVAIQDRGKVILINCGDGDTVSYTVLPFLRSLGANQLHLAIAAQNPLDSAWSFILDNLEVKTFLATSEKPESLFLSENKVKYQLLTLHQEAKLAGVTVSVISLNPVALQIQLRDRFWILADETTLPQLQQQLSIAQNWVWIATKPLSSLDILQQLPIEVAIAPSLASNSSKPIQSYPIQLYLTEKVGAIQWTPKQGFQPGVLDAEADAELL
ncbi:MAG: ComEC/Rec2 family competence protein [Jaaginema sp. PMC 1079.18]|nr:ComEC/Rec2 family competence protein [Jaaginema sp. PMC 1080.18]MEC4853214.1 ComEC/Rec2 family competence protein [Jaaginema sp. PMC 1079.18]MEC4865566.1 ComEC/Rec2 family competence protein [Jaaginema sp. PMC 1078.18]